MFRFAEGLTRLARRARGGLFALRVTRRGTGRLEALRLEVFEVLTVVSIDWLVGWLIVCLANVT
mgnify:CR=1 FL=1